MLLDALASLVIGRKPEGSFPCFGRFMTKASFLVQDRQVLSSGEVFRVQLHGSLERSDGFIYLPLLSMEQT